MRQAERENCVAHRNSESCILPISETAVHRERSGAEAAIACLEQTLALSPNDYIAIWLLNLAHMTLGSYPAKVPGRYLIPPSAFASEYQLATLVGTTTAGRLVATSAFKVGFGYRVVMPVATYFTWHGTNLEGRGLQPTVEEPFSFEASVEGRDNQLERAMQIVRETTAPVAVPS